MVFGSGKVGRGAAMKARGAGADVTFVETNPRAQPPAECTPIPADDVAAVRGRLASAWCVTSATGVRGALDPWAEFLIRSAAVLANLCADDEFGPHMPPDRVLHDKAPVNFALAEPTRLRYLDATFALHNACALALLAGGQHAGLNRTPRAVEDEILAEIRASSAICGGRRLLTGEGGPRRPPTGSMCDPCCVDRIGQGSSGSLTGMTTSFLRRNHGVHGGSKRA